MKPLLVLLPIILLAGCVGNPERDCGLYDFDCDGVPAGDALFTPGQTGSPAAPPASAASDVARQVKPPVDDLTTRVQLLEEETRRLRRRIEILEQGH